MFGLSLIVYLFTFLQGASKCTSMQQVQSWKEERGDFTTEETRAEGGGVCSRINSSERRTKDFNEEVKKLFYQSVLVEIFVQIIQIYNNHCILKKQKKYKTDCILYKD